MKSVAIYARVSSERQAQDATVDSQVEALKQRVAKDGHQLLPEQCFVDDSFSGSSLYRPALEKLRKRCTWPVVSDRRLHCYNFGPELRLRA